MVCDHAGRRPNVTKSNGGEVYGTHDGLINQGERGPAQPERSLGRHLFT